MFEGTIKINHKSLPRTLLGTSPFTAAPHFGHRAWLYQLDLYRQPENIAKVIKKSYDLGVRGIQLIPYPPVVDAFKQAVEEGCNFLVLGTVRQGEEEADIKLLSSLGAEAMLLQGAITDTCNWETITKHLEAISSEGSIAGLATDQPFHTSPELLKSPVLDLFNIYMTPLNKLGYLMDTEVFMEKQRLEYSNLMKKLDKKVIINRTLAAGVLNPNDAFEFLKTVDYADIVAVGVAYEKEAAETFNLLAKK